MKILFFYLVGEPVQVLDVLGEPGDALVVVLVLPAHHVDVVGLALDLLKGHRQAVKKQQNFTTLDFPFGLVVCWLSYPFESESHSTMNSYSPSSLCEDLDSMWVRLTLLSLKISRMEARTPLPSSDLGENTSQVFFFGSHPCLMYWPRPILGCNMRIGEGPLKKISTTKSLE